MSEQELFVGLVFILGLGTGIAMCSLMALWTMGVRSWPPPVPVPEPEFPRSFQKVGPNGIEPITVSIYIPPEARP